MQRFVRFFLPFLFTLLIYFLVLPWLALQLDQRFSFIWRLPFWTETIAAFLILISGAIILRYFWVRAYHNNGSFSVNANGLHIVESGRNLAGRSGACMPFAFTLSGGHKRNNSDCRHLVFALFRRPDIVVSICQSCTVTRQ